MNRFQLLFLALTFSLNLLLSLQLQAQICYSSTLASGCASNYISNVSILGTTLNHSSYCDGLNFQGVSFFPDTGNATGIVDQGYTYMLSVTLGTPGSSISAWFDYNHDSIFDTSEWYQVASSAIVNVPSIVSITIPFTGLLGQTHMRIRVRSALLTNNASSACTTWLAGELEEYTLNVSNGLGVGGFNNKVFNLIILPNPSKGKVEIRGSNNNTVKMQLQLVDVTGRIVYTEHFENNAALWSKTVDWSAEPKGIYFVKLISDTQVHTQKIVIE